MTLDLEAIKARCEAARMEVNRLCQRGQGSWTMSIPVREDDSDIVLTASFRDIPALVAEVERLQSEIKERERHVSDAESSAHFHRQLYAELKGFTDEWKRRAEKAEVEVERLRGSLEDERGCEST